MLYIKALHIIFMVTWFAGMFYIVRLFIYQTEAKAQSAEAQAILIPQYKLMSKRLWYGITVPSAILTLIFGPWLLWERGFLEDFGLHSWLHIKLFFVLLLYIYFMSLHRIFTKLQKDDYTRSAQFLRIWNEVATIFLVVIVFLAVVKDTLSWLWGLLYLCLFIIILMSAIKIYKTTREKK